MTPLIRPARTRRGFLPDPDPLVVFPEGSPLSALDAIGETLPLALEAAGFREYAAALEIPAWPVGWGAKDHLPELRLYYLRLAFLVSGYVHQLNQPKVGLVPRNLAVPLVRACGWLGRPPILSEVRRIAAWPGPLDADLPGRSLGRIASVVRAQTRVLRRIPEAMDPDLYYRTFRPYIGSFEGIVYEGVSEQPRHLRGETGAQSTIMPLLVSLMKIPHRESPLIDHLHDMRRYMPVEHGRLLRAVDAMPSLRGLTHKRPFNAVLEAMAEFREVHYGWAQRYITQRVADPRGTGGTPYRQWLRQLIRETLAHRIR
ncbi:MAG: hypothetical protein U9R74_05275 [Pseudomonadota bacterium]|nr:hypothetical protein [Pseudomonadota bacterium]